MTDGQQMASTIEARAKVKLMKMSKGYQWEISMSGDDPMTCVKEIYATDLQLRELYAGEEKRSDTLTI